MTTTSTSLSMSQLRRRARDRGLTLSRVPERSRWFAQYGPLMLCDTQTGVVVHACLDLEDVLGLLAD